MQAASVRAIGGSDADGGRPPVVVVAGPTASGKSALALRVAEAFDGVVINADSMQVYRDLHVLTARPGEAETARVPHRLFGVLDGAEICSAGRWRAMAVEEVDRALAEGRLPVVAGGTGLYLSALIDGLSPIPEVPRAFTEAMTQRWREEGGPALHAALAARDPETAARLRPTDGQRLVRALAVLEATGRPLAAWQREAREAAPFTCHVVLLMPPRAELYAACDRRYAAMMDNGAVEEVEALLARGLPGDRPVMKAIGVGQIAAMLEGRMTRDAAVAAAQQATRNYAKRQCTWFRHQIIAAHIVAEKFSESITQEILSKIRRFGLTAADRPHSVRRP